MGHHKYELPAPGFNSLATEQLQTSFTLFGLSLLAAGTWLHRFGSTSPLGKVLFSFTLGEKSQAPRGAGLVLKPHLCSHLQGN